ncbi:MAG: hypothetical protein ACU0B7_03485 [Paracoccaceae bacterium]
MQLLSTNRVYDVENDCFRAEFMQLVASPPDDLIVIDGNAGLGADWPAAIWRHAGNAALALTIISAPSTIEENWPRWKSIYDAVVEKVVEFHGEYRIDRDTAQVLALHHAVTELGLSSSRLEVHMALRHYYSSVPGYDDLLTSPSVVMDWPNSAGFDTPEFSQGVRSNEEAARQAIGRYIFGINDLSKAFTIIIESDGQVSMSRELKINKSWG